MDADDLRDHLGEVDTHLQGLGLDEEIIGELVQLPDDLRSGERGKATTTKKSREGKSLKRAIMSKRGNTSNADGCNLRLKGGGFSF